ncbi:MAG TPA: hypothetical protein VLL08_28745 [Kineosporiaceae bacterium]|nr:hypothetical protein [Kineosporiaceae bacterium]
MSDQAEPVLAGALERLVQNGTLSGEQADAVRTSFHLALQTDQQHRPRTTPWTAVLAEVGGYVGAAFVVAAAIALVGPQWENFSVAGRATVLAGPAVLLLIAAIAIAVGVPGTWRFRPAAMADPSQAHRGSGVEDVASAPIRRLIGALVLAGGGLLGGATAVLIQDTDGERWVSLVPLLVWGVGYLLCRGVPLHLGTAAALTWTVLSVIDVNLDDQFPLSGLVLMLAGAGWAVLAGYRLIEEQELAIAVAGVMAFTGGEIVATSDYEGLGYLLLGLLAVMGLGGYIRTHWLSALGVGAVTLAVVVPQVVIDYTEDSLGAAGGLLVSGLSVVAVSALAARLRRSGSAVAAGPTSGPPKVV